jgi:hypothetical protein
MWHRYAVPALFLLLPIGCLSRSTAPSVEAAPYVGPPLAFDESGATTVLVMTAPTPGWQMSLDRVDEKFRSREVFVTLRKPFPGYAYAQVEVLQRLATTAPREQALVLFVRTIEHDAPVDLSDAYRPVTTRPALSSRP